MHRSGNGVGCGAVGVVGDTINGDLLTLAFFGDGGDVDPFGILECICKISFAGVRAGMGGGGIKDCQLGSPAL